MVATVSMLHVVKVEQVMVVLALVMEVVVLLVGLFYGLPRVFGSSYMSTDK